MKPKKRKFKCEGCGKARPCFVETNQEPSDISIIEKDLKCILDPTNQTGYNWVEINNNLTRPESNDDSVEGVVVTDAFVNWLLDPVCDRTDSVGRLNAEDIPKLLQEFNATDSGSSLRDSTNPVVEGGVK
jgi:hypothetical protein